MPGPFVRRFASPPAREILRERSVRWVLAYDGERVAENSAALLGEPVPADPHCSILDALPSRAPALLNRASQNGASNM